LYWIMIYDILSYLVINVFKQNNTDVGSSSSIHLKCFSFQTPTKTRGIRRSVLFMSPRYPLLFSHDVAEQLTKMTINTNNLTFVIDLMYSWHNAEIRMIHHCRNIHDTLQKYSWNISAAYAFFRAGGGHWSHSTYNKMCMHCKITTHYVSWVFLQCVISISAMCHEYFLQCHEYFCNMKKLCHEYFCNMSWIFLQYFFFYTNELINIYTYILILNIAYIITCWGLFVDNGTVE
jgi:hypothetical protein